MESAQFGPFRLFAAARRLLKEDAPVPLGSRALDILILLVAKAGSVVTKQELLAQVWPDVTVEDSSVRVHVAMLRRALNDGRDGARYIVNVAGRGYCFVGEVRRNGAHRKTPGTIPRPARVIGFPGRPGRMIDREGDVREITVLLKRRRFVTIHGPGGIGKTTVGMAVAAHLADSYADGACFLDLGLRSSAGSVPDTLGTQLGLILQASDPTPSIVNYLRDRQMLLVFDCCEHVLPSAAALAEAIFHEAPQIEILATSREPLRAEGEQVYRLPPLPTPPKSIVHDRDGLLSYPAAQLFHERAVAAGYREELTDEDVQFVAAICHKVDGIALALELAAARVSTHGLRETAALLDGRLSLLWQGRRTAPPRQQTLHATLDWSHNLIAERERGVLRRLSVFVGPFTLPDAQAVVADEGISTADVVEALAQLVSQSLVLADTRRPATLYRLLDTTRAYAQAKLADSGEGAAFARRHARACLDYLSRAGDASSAEGRSTGRAGDLANVRSALEWSFSEAGDADLGVGLAAASGPLFLGASLLRECSEWTARAIQLLAVDLHGTRIEMALCAALGYASLFTGGDSDRARATLERALEIAETLNDLGCRFFVLDILHHHYRQRGDYRQLLAIARQAESVALRLHDPATVGSAKAMLGASQYLTGDFGSARVALEAAARLPVHASRAMPNLLGSRGAAQFVLALTLWLQGFPDQAVAVLREAERRDEPSPLSACRALILAMHVYQFRGDWDIVEDYLDRLIEQSREYSLEPLRLIGIGFRGELLLKRGDADGGMDLLRDAIGGLRSRRFEIYVPSLTAALSLGLAQRGLLGQALSFLNEQIARVEEHGGAFNLADLLRVRGVILARSGDEAGAELAFERSLALADAQTALSWRLRTATDLAGLRLRQRRRDGAQSVLADTYAQFTEGFSTCDLRTAKATLEEIEPTGG